MLLLHWLVSACAIMLTSYVLPRATVTFVGALIASIILGLANIFIKPILLFFTLPINILTLGFFTIVINGLIILLVSALTPGFKVGGLGMAILFAIVLTIINMIFFKISGV
jgi:putative membrane protein